MQQWDLNEIETPEGTRSPVVLYSREGERRVVVIGVEPGQALSEHQVKEAALVLVVDGRVQVEAADESVDAPAGTLFRFEPDERHSVTSAGGARLLLLLAPWPGEGHYRGDPSERSGVSAS
ncbi:MAG TPA: AraC family ligand binding domain-containing protein [Gaiellaceae bacterium]